MSEFYEFEGTTYEVGPNKLEDFMKKFPNATKAQQSFEIESLEGFKESPLLEGDGMVNLKLWKLLMKTSLVCLLKNKEKMVEMLYQQL